MRRGGSRVGPDAGVYRIEDSQLSLVDGPRGVIQRIGGVCLRVLSLPFRLFHVMLLALAADLLANGWDQPAFNAVTSPVAAAVEDVAGRWLVELLGLPAGASFGFVTGGQGANTVGLAAARHNVLARAGWDVSATG